jgi:hypothetical protein
MTSKLLCAAGLAAGLATSGTALGATRLPSRFVPGDRLVSAAANEQSAPSLSQGGGTLLAVWTDNRANATGGYESETSWDVYGMRFDGAGNALDAQPFVIAAGPAAQKFPRAAWNGSHWLVVFESVDFGGTGYYQASLEALRVAPDGHVLDPKPIKLFNLTPVGATWALASDGSGWVVANQGTTVNGDIVAVRVSGAGVLLDPAPRALVPATYYLRGGFHLAYAGGVFLLAYEESMTGSDLTRAIRFDAGLNLLDPAPFGLAPAPLGRLVSNGSGFYAAWHEQLPDFTMAVKGSRIGTNGQKLDGSGVIISGANGPAAYTTTSVAWDGSQWKVTWGAASGTRLARVSSAGQVLDPGGVAIAGAKTGASASAGNGSVQLAWSEYVLTSAEVFSAYINASNAAGPTRTLSIGAPAQTRADVATSGSGYMLVYRSSTATRHRILAQPLDAAGNPLTAEPFELDAAESPNYPVFPRWRGTAPSTWSRGTTPAG